MTTPFSLMLLSRDDVNLLLAELRDQPHDALDAPLLEARRPSTPTRQVRACPRQRPTSACLPSMSSPFAPGWKARCSERAMATTKPGPTPSLASGASMR